MRTAAEIISQPTADGLALAVIGAGALGSAFVHQLSQTEVTLRKVLIIDPDCLTPRNIALSAIFSAQFAVSHSALIGQHKAKMLAAAGESRWQKIATAHCCEIADLGWGELQDCDLLISCSDSTLARVEACITATSLRIPMLDGGVREDGSEGRVSWFTGGAGDACFLCGLTTKRRAEVLAYALSASLGCKTPAETTPMGEALQVPPSMAPTVNQMLLQIFEYRHRQARDTQRRRRGSESTTMRWTGNAWNANQRRLPISAGCPLHELERPRWMLLRADVSLQDQLGGEVDQVDLPWPMCFRVRCRVCGMEAPRRERVALVRRAGRCHACGEVGHLDPLDCVSTIRRGDLLAERTPGQLGLPKQQLVAVRRAFVWNKGLATGAGRQDEPRS